MEIEKKAATERREKVRTCQGSRRFSPLGSFSEFGFGLIERAANVAFRRQKFPW